MFCCQQPVLLCNFNMALNFATNILHFVLQGDNDLTKDLSQSCEPNKLAKVKVSALSYFQSNLV